jgi:hypothetical protein
MQGVSWDLGLLAFGVKVVTQGRTLYLLDLPGNGSGTVL